MTDPQLPSRRRNWWQTGPAGSENAVSVCHSKQKETRRSGECRRGSISIHGCHCEDLIAYELRIRRERAGLTGTQLGARIGCVRSTVSRLESGHLRLDLKQAVLVDKALDT